MKGPLQPTIARAGQAYVDDGVYINPKRPSIIAQSVQHAFEPNRRQPERILIGYARVKLNWITPPDQTTE